MIYEWNNISLFAVEIAIHPPVICSMTLNKEQQDHPSSTTHDRAQGGLGSDADVDLELGITTIKKVVKTLSEKPGVYRMLDAKGDVLYVGKARSLKARVTSYTQPNRLTNRIMRMVGQTRSMVVVTTHTEAEALLLEANLIKRYRTPYNVLLRDDKSLPYILLRKDHPWPQITKHRGAQKVKGDYFGPFASGGAVNQTLNAMQRVFQLRSCSDSVFNNRSRPCMLYQIKRCSAPCVDRINVEDYDQMVQDTKAFLQGRTSGIQKALADMMENASNRMDYETAAIYRDRIRALAQIQSRQDINLSGLDDADIIAIANKGGSTCVQVFFLRGGQNWGNRAFFPRHERGAELSEIMSAFVAQFYENKYPPKEILLSEKINDMALMADALAARSDHRVSLHIPQRGDKKRLIELALRNAQEALDRRLAESASQARLLQAMADVFELDMPPARIEVYDNSHIQGRHAVGGMIVAGPEGFIKNAYRKFNIKDEDITPGDDYGMMREVMQRRFSRLMKEDEDHSKGNWPDLVLIDGGAGQLSAVVEVMNELGLEDEVTLIAVAKGPDRNAGHEVFYRPGRQPMTLPTDSPVLYYIQRLRDEAHRFAIGTHRAKRAKALVKSPLDSVPGIGAKRKRALLYHFGTAHAVTRAGVEDLARVDGISEHMAQVIYDHFHGGA